MAIDSNSQKRPRLPLGLGRILMVWLVFVILGLITVFFAGIAYFFLLFWLVHMVITVAMRTPKLYRLLFGASLYERNRGKLLTMFSSRGYRIHLVVTNVFYLVITVFLFKFNFRLAELLFK